jgi:hypothetical protein
MIFCRNCGYKNHCGEPLWKENINPLEGDTLYKVCDHCHCEVCINEEKTKN